MSKYGEYRHIDLPWLKEIPAHWDIWRNKNIFTEIKEEVGKNASSYTLLSLTLNGIVPRDVESGKGKFPEKFDKYKVVKPGYMAFCLFDIDETPRTVGLSSFDGMLTGAYTIMRVDNVNPRFAYYYYLSLDNAKAMRPLYSGLRKTIKNENQCLIYNRPIPSTGVMWNDLVDWYAEEKNIDENREIVFIKRLCECLDTSFKAQGAKSGPETWMLQAYYNLKKELGKDLPALIPQVYLYYDPQTLKQRGYKLFEHQKMDFLMIFSHKDRVVIEIDGRQHYAEGNSASPRLYSEMVRAQREMTLFGYDVYRFGGYEFVGADSDEKKKEAVLDDLKQFFLRLFSKYSAL